MVRTFAILVLLFGGLSLSGSASAEGHGPYKCAACEITDQRSPLDEATFDFLEAIAVLVGVQPGDTVTVCDEDNCATYENNGALQWESLDFFPNTVGNGSGGGFGGGSYGAPPLPGGCIGRCRVGGVVRVGRIGG